MRTRTALGWYGGGEVAGRGLHWLTLTLLPFLLPAVEYGKVGIAAAAVALSSNLCLVGQDKAILKFDQAANSTSIALLIVTTSTTLLTIAALGLLQDNSEALLFGSAVFLYTVHRLFLATVRGARLPRKFFTIRTTGAVGAMGTAVLLASQWNSYASYLIGLLVGSGGGCILGAIVVLKMRRQGGPYAGSDHPQPAEMLAFGWPYIFHIIGGSILAFSDRLILERLEGLAAVGEYTFAYSVAGALSTVYVALGLHYEPIVFRLGHSPSTRADVLREFTYVGLSMTIPLAAMIIGGIQLMQGFLVARGYTDTLAIVIFVLVGYIGSLWYVRSAMVLASINRTGTVALSTIVTAFANIPLTIFAVWRFGVIGAALATMVSYCGLSLVMAGATSRILARS